MFASSVAIICTVKIHQVVLCCYSHMLHVSMNLQWIIIMEKGHFSALALSPSCCPLPAAHHWSSCQQEAAKHEHSCSAQELWYSSLSVFLQPCHLLDSLVFEYSTSWNVVVCLKEIRTCLLNNFLHSFLIYTCVSFILLRHYFAPQGFSVSFVVWNCYLCVLILIHCHNLRVIIFQQSLNIL